ncbi:putative aromatic-ring-hydroxylating dioxygenase, alpha subunit, rieske [2Fe-2S] iron-sulfur [Septoria linicola]|nr:putative aromatic-ring-hydroxylating dioxygenase, alpha subunit, rieske [2Fe-2S] iron-sulfur [Septoria linicola]
MNRLFDFNSKPAPELIKEPLRALPASWYRSASMAYPVVEQEAGKASILACRYHGWSYGLDGQLAKGPKYQDVEGFDKTTNSLFPVHVHEDQLGFIWINLDSSATPDPWAQDYEGKTLADNYNECYHCPTGGQIEHWNTAKEGEEGNFQILSSFLYPNATITVAPAFFYIGRWILTSAGETRMEYEYYRRSDGKTDDKDFHFYVETFKQVLQEDKDPCTAAQKNLNAGIFQNGQLHLEAEKGPLYFQNLTKMLVMAHHEEEQQNGGLPIWPAVPKHSITAANETEIAFCANLACGELASQQELSWYDTDHLSGILAALS